MPSSTSIPIIVQGNSFSLAIPLQIYVISEGSMVLQDYTPEPTDEISIQLKGERRQYTYTPTVDGNICNIDLSGNELAGNYSVVVSIVKASGQRLRSFRTDQFFIVESSDDLTPEDIIEGLENNVIYLNSQAFVAGEDGRGIDSIVKTSTSGLVDTYTITYTDATTSTFNVTNGAAGEAGATIASVEKTATVGKVDTYTITMTNGSTFDFEVTNGLDGVDLGLANIINDLTTGGSTNVLSAEQGKVLKGMIDIYEPLLSIKGVRLAQNSVSSIYCKDITGTFVSDTSEYATYYAPVQAGETIHITATDSVAKNARICFSENVPALDGACSNFTQISSQTAIDVTLVAPFDGYVCLSKAKVYFTNLVFEKIVTSASLYYKELSFVGAGQTGVRSDYVDCRIAPKVNYRLYLPTEIDMTGIQVVSGTARFTLNLCNNDDPTEMQRICRYDLGEDLPEYVEFSTDDAEHTTLVLFGRCASGVTFIARLVQAQGGGSGSGELFADREPLRDIIANKSDKTFLFFSDIHAQRTNMAHILDVAKRWSEDGKLDAILNGGDTTYEVQSNDISWYFDAIDACGVDVVFALGNHEIKGTTSAPATLATAYTKYIAPTIQRLTGAVQPSGASTNSLCYYYKDYGNLRVISFDTPNTNALPSNPPYAVNAQDAAAYLEAENIWLEGVLADAKTNNKQVLILTHYPFEWTDAEIAEGTENWNSFYRYEKGEVDNPAKWDIADSTCDVVDAFINGGGYFVGWFTGHIHYNNFVTNEQHPKQIMWNIGTARNDYGQADMPYTTDPSNPSYDQFCYIGIDLTHHLLKIMKIGRQRCNQLRYQNCICWDYKNNVLIGNND